MSDAHAPAVLPQIALADACETLLPKAVRQKMKAVGHC